MKKQILFIILAILASVHLSYGQPNIVPPTGTTAATCLDPTPIDATCIPSGKLNPVAGTEYTYTANLPTPVGNKNYRWFVTDDLTLIDAGALTTDIDVIGGDYVAAGSGTYNTVTSATAPQDVSVDITWKAFTHNPSAPVLLVLYVEDASDCTNNNIEAYLIRPVHAFTLDIAPMASNGSIPDTPLEICVSPVQTATYVITNAATGEGEIQFDYGTNYMFFVVTAANFTDSWMPRFEIDGAALGASRTVTAIDWAYPDDAVSGTWVTSMTGTGTAGGIWTGTTAVEAQDPSGSVDADGECIVVRLTIANNQDETTTNEALTLAVDGIMLNETTGDYTTASLGDIHYTSGTGAAEACPWYDGFENDVASQDLAPRPDINAVDPTPFVPTDRNN